MEKDTFTTLQDQQIEEIRNKMIRAAKLHGFQHPLVLHYSQQLDRKHNDLLRTDPKVRTPLHHSLH